VAIARNQSQVGPGVSAYYPNSDRITVPTSGRFTIIKGSDAIDVGRLEHLAVLNRNTIKVQLRAQP